MKRFRSASSVWLNTFVYNHPFLHRGAGVKWAMHECNYGDVICVLGHCCYFFWSYVCSHVTFWFVLCIVCFHPANRLIFRSFFMSQCKLIHVDSVQKRRRVDFWDCVCVRVCAHVSVQVGRLRVIRGAWHWCEIWCRCQRLCIVAWRRASAYHPVLSRFWLSWHCNTGRCAGKCVDRNQFLDLFFSPHGRAPRCPRITQNDATERKSKGKKLLRLPGEVTFFPVNVKELQVPRSHTSKIQREGARPGVIVLQWLNL